jgi:hypothetical protein
MHSFQILAILGLLLLSVDAFRPASSPSRRDILDRRTLVKSVGLLTFLPVQQALASGGATAGGVYLLSAKQRYNERVNQGVQGFLAVGAALDKGDLNTAKDFFAGEEPGSWKDLSAAGYLLANAFRRNSTAAPDSLPTVKVSCVEPDMSTTCQGFDCLHPVQNLLLGAPLCRLALRVHPEQDVDDNDALTLAVETPDSDIARALTKLFILFTSYRLSKRLRLKSNS